MKKLVEQTRIETRDRIADAYQMDSPKQPEMTSLFD